MTPSKSDERLGLCNTIGRLFRLDIFRKLTVGKRLLVHFETHLGGGSVGEQGGIRRIELVGAREGIDGFRVFFGGEIRVALAFQLLRFLFFIRGGFRGMGGCAVDRR